MDVKKIAQLTGHTGAIFAITEGGDEQHILSGAGDGWVVEWDLAKPEVGRLVAKVERNIFSLLFIQHQNRLIAGDMDGGVRFRIRIHACSAGRRDVKRPERVYSVPTHPCPTQSA